MYDRVSRGRTGGRSGVHSIDQQVLLYKGHDDGGLGVKGPSSSRKRQTLYLPSRLVPVPITGGWKDR